VGIEIAIDGTKFFIDGRPTYEGRTYQGRAIEGLLMNARMVQAIFDDECPETAYHWRYPDTGVWDPDRNTNEFCAQLPAYRRYGLLAVTVGLQGGGSTYTPAIYGQYINSAFAPDGSLKPAYLDRLARVLDAADAAGMVVIVNYFYVQQMRHIPDDGVVYHAIESVTDWLLRTGHRNLLVDVANESAPWWSRPIFEPENAHRLIDAAKSVTLDGRRLLTSISTGGGQQIAADPWMEAEDFSLPHGNGLMPDQLAAKIRRWREQEPYRRRPRPIVINEDSVFIENMEAAVAEGASWGFYCQGYGSAYKDRMDWTVRGREERYEDLSGYQTVPVNWGINTPIKRAFFDRLRAITGGA
jgi:hypothetical protein